MGKEKKDGKLQSGQIFVFYVRIYELFKILRNPSIKYWDLQHIIAFCSSVEMGRKKLKLLYTICRRVDIILLYASS